MFRAAASLWKDNTAYLGDIDSRFGDGDHGVTVEKIANFILNRTDEWEDENIKKFLESLSEGILGISGGSAGALYGMFVEGLATPLSYDASEVGPKLLKAMLTGGRDAMFSITKACVGDKTLMDVLLPAVEAADEADDDILSILRAADEAAEQGLEATKGMVSKVGRARNYGEKTLGTPDVGASSAALLFKGFLLGAEKAVAEIAMGSGDDPSAEVGAEVDANRAASILQGAFCGGWGGVPWLLSFLTKA
jgi:dihydroxyacetone kinase-like protein